MDPIRSAASTRMARRRTDATVLSVALLVGSVGCPSTLQLSAIAASTSIARRCHSRRLACSTAAVEGRAMHGLSAAAPTLCDSRILMARAAASSMVGRGRLASVPGRVPPSAAECPVISLSPSGVPSTSHRGGTRARVRDASICRLIGGFVGGLGTVSSAAQGDFPLNASMVRPMDGANSFSTNLGTKESVP